MVVLKNIKGRITSVPLPLTYARLMAAAVSGLGLMPGTIRLIVRGVELKPPPDVDDEVAAERALREAGVNDDTEVIAIGLKSHVMTPSPASTTTGAPALTPGSSRTPTANGGALNSGVAHHPHGGASPRQSGLLSFPHVPDGLIEVTRGVEGLTDDYHRFRFLEGHVTIQAIRELVQGDVRRLEAIIKQAAEVHPPFVEKVVRAFPQMFLDVINGKQRRFLQDLFAPPASGSAVMSAGDMMMMFDDGDEGDGEGEGLTSDQRDNVLAQAGLEVMEALGALFGSDVEVNVAIGGDDADDMLHGGGGDRGELDWGDEGDIAALQAELDLAVTEGNHISAAACHVQIAAAERSKANDAPSVAEAERISSHYSAAVEHALRMPDIVRSDELGLAIAAVSSVGPQVFVAAQLWFLERGDARKSLEVCVAHFSFWDALERGHRSDVADKSPTETVDELLALCASEGGDFTVVIYSLLKDDALYVTYVVRQGEVIGRTARFVADAFRAVLIFMETSLQKQGAGVNAMMVWAEQLGRMYESFIAPIEDLLPRRPADLFSKAAHVCFVPTMTKIALPFAAMMDNNGVPAIAKWEVSQCRSVDAVLDASIKAQHARRTASTPPPSLVVADTRPAWLTHTIRRALDVEVAPTARLPRASVLHLEDASRAVSCAAELVVGETFSRELLDSLATSCTTGFVRCMDPRGEAPYELMRHFYRCLCHTGSVTTAGREAMLRCAEASPTTLWQWASFTVVNYVSKLPSLESRAQSATVVAKQQTRRRRVLMASSEAHYTQLHSIGELYDEMVHCLLDERPTHEDAVLGSLISFLERNRERLEGVCANEGDSPRLGSRSVSETAPAHNDLTEPVPKH